MWECVEMGERNTMRQQPGYDGLCNYAQKITSCFGLDGKRGGNKAGGCVCFSLEVIEAMTMFVMYFFVQC